MSEDIKMADVFCLPLTDDAGFVQEVDGRFIADLDSNEMDEAVVHAVNSHDKLTSRVAELDGYSSLMKRDNLSLHKKVAVLEAALCEISNMCVGEIAMNYRLDAQCIGEIIYKATGLTNPELNKALKESE